MRAKIVHVAGQGAIPSQPLLLSVFCLCLLPQSILIATTFYFLRWLKSVTFSRSSISRHAIGTKQILVTGDNASSILGMSRALRSAGHDVYVVDYERIPFLNALRSSNAITQFIGLPTGRVAPSVTAIKARLFHLGSLINISFSVNQKQPLANLFSTIVQLIESKKIELWIPCEANGLQTVLQTKEVVTKHSTCQIYGPDSEATQISQDRQRFSQHVEGLGHDIQFPSAIVVRSRAEIHHHLSSAPSGQKFFIERTTSQFKQPIPSVTEGMEVGVSTAPFRISKDSRIPLDREYRPLPLKSLSETYSSVAALTISQDQPWLLHQVIEGKSTSASALVVNNSVCAFMANTSSHIRTFSSARKGRASSGQIQRRNGSENWQQFEAAKALDPNSAISQKLLEFTEQFARQLPENTNAQLNLHFIMTEHATPGGVVLKFWATGCDFGISPTLIQYALSFGHLESIGAAYSCGLNGGPVVFPMLSTTADDVNSNVTYSLPVAAYRNIWVPIREAFLLRASIGGIVSGIAQFFGQVAFGQEVLFDWNDPLPWVWTWLVQFPVEQSLDVGENVINSLIRYSKRSASNRP